MQLIIQSKQALWDSVSEWELPYWKGHLRGLHSSWISYRNAPEICSYLLNFFYYLQKQSKVANADLHAGLQEHTCSDLAGWVMNST